MLVPGPAGPQGVSGLTGPPGTSPYIHTQSTPASTWIITHNLGYYPSGVSVIDSSLDRVYPSIAYSSVNVVTLLFANPNSGLAFIN